MSRRALVEEAERSDRQEEGDLSRLLRLQAETFELLIATVAREYGRVGREDRHETGGVGLAVGEPAGGLAGWRLTHCQAAAALTVAKRPPAPVVRYREVALLATACRDELLRSSLEQVFLAPLCSDREGGAALRLTLEAWFAPWKAARQSCRRPFASVRFPGVKLVEHIDKARHVLIVKGCVLIPMGAEAPVQRAGEI